MGGAGRDVGQGGGEMGRGCLRRVRMKWAIMGHYTTCFF